MKRKHFSEEQIIKALKSNEASIKVIDICHQLGIAEQTFYRWRSKYDGMEVSAAKRRRELEAGNSKLKKLLAEMVMKYDTTIRYRKSCQKSSKADAAQADCQRAGKCWSTQ